MTTEPSSERGGLRAPRVAAAAGLIFSVLLTAILLLLRGAIPADPREPGRWLKTDLSWVEMALNLLPFAAIAF